MALAKNSVGTLMSLTSNSSNAATLGSAINVTTAVRGGGRVRMGRANASAFTIPAVFRIEQSATSGTPTTQDWFSSADSYSEFSSLLGVTLVSQSVTGGGGSTATTFTVGSITNISAQNYGVLQNGTLASSEFVRVNGAASTTVTILEPLINSQASSTFRNGAEMWRWSLDLTDVNYIRGAADGSGTGQPFLVEMTYCLLSGP